MSGGEGWLEVCNMKTKLLATIEADESLRKRFQTKELSKEWREKYPELFDDDDLRLALTQPENHFYEWLAAIHLYKENGYYSLLEKYQYKNHKHKQSIVQKLDFKDLRRVMDYQRMKNQVQLPDLLVYKPDFSDWFFCEVKGGTDRLRPEQEEQFEIFSALSKKPIYMIKINSIKAQESK
jgi:hypothetical protein